MHTHGHTHGHTHADRARRSRHTRRMRNMQINYYFSLSSPSSITAYIECYYSLCWYFLTFLRYLIIWLCKIIDRHSFICLFLLLITLIIKSLTAKRDKEREGDNMRSYAACLFAHDLLETSTQCWQCSRLICKTDKFKLSFP